VSELYLDGRRFNCLRTVEMLLEYAESCLKCMLFGCHADAGIRDRASKPAQDRDRGTSCATAPNLCTSLVTYSSRAGGRNVRIGYRWGDPPARIRLGPAVVEFVEMKESSVVFVPRWEGRPTR
jgi:hypothetical protein